MANAPHSPLIPLMRPMLVQHEYIVPYLSKIDVNRWYSNFGPLVQQLEARMAEFFGTGEHSVVTVSNGTSGLTNILRAFNLPRGTLCILPSWTFVATPAAVVAAGLVPYFVDVSEKTWALDPKEVKRHVESLEGKVSAVMTVAPYGSPQDTLAWDRFTDETGIPVIIDAAAAFDAFSRINTCKPRENPVMVSLHATKMFGIGEGGLVISSNSTLIRRIREMSNFGFSADRSMFVPGTNGKMSEYSAAVALATLDLWPQIRELWICLKELYRRAFADISPMVGAELWMQLEDHDWQAFAEVPPTIDATRWIAEDWAASTLNIRLKTKPAAQVIEQLVAAGIESRQWWGKGCHTLPAYANFPRAPLPVTERLGGSVMALPFTLDIKKQDVDHIVQTLSRVLGQA